MGHLSLETLFQGNKGFNHLSPLGLDSSDSIRFINRGQIVD